MPDTAPPPAPSPEQAIADSRSAYEQFLKAANDEVFTPQQEARYRASGLNPVADAFARSAQQVAASAAPAPPSQPRSPDGRFAPTTPAPAASSPAASPSSPQAAPAAAAVAIPGAPTGTSISAPAPAAPAASASAAAPSAAAADEFADIPAANAFDNPAAQPPRSNDWRRLHAKADRYIEGHRKLQAELEALRAAQAAPAASAPEAKAQLDALAAERDNLREIVQRVAFEQSPQFKQMFGQREQAALLLAKGAVGPEKADQVSKLLSQPDSIFRNQQLAALLKDVGDEDPIRAGKLTNAIAAIDALAAEKAVVLENNKAYIAQIQADRAVQESRMQQQRQAAVATTFDTIVKDWKGAGLSDSDIATARRVFMGDSDLDNAAKAAMWAVYGPKAAGQALALQQQVATLTAELNKLRGVQPGAASDAGGGLPHTDDSAITTPVRQGMYSEGIIQEAMKQGLAWR